MTGIPGENDRISHRYDDALISPSSRSPVRRGSGPGRGPGVGTVQETNAVCVVSLNGFEERPVCGARWPRRVSLAEIHWGEAVVRCVKTVASLRFGLAC